MVARLSPASLATSSRLVLLTPQRATQRSVASTIRLSCITDTKLPILSHCQTVSTFRPRLLSRIGRIPYPSCTKVVRTRPKSGRAPADHPDLRRDGGGVRPEPT